MYYQNEKKDCARSALKNLLVLIYKDEKLSNVYIDRTINDFYSMSEYLKQYNIFYDGFLVEDIDEIKKENFPVIAQIKNQSYKHFVVVKNIDKKNVYYIDSEHGEIKMSKKEFLTIFEGNILAKVKDVKAKKIEKLSFLKISEKIFYFLFFITEIFTIISTIYLLNQKNSFPFPLIFLVITLFEIVVFNIYNYKIRKKLDKRILIPYLMKYPNKENFYILTKLLDEYIKKINYIFNYGIVIIVGSFLFLNNTIYISILALVSILIASYLLLNKKNLNPLIRKSKMKESDFIEKLESGEVDISLLSELKKDVSSSLIMNIYPLFIEFIFISMVILLNMYKDNISSINNYLFYIFFTFTYTSSLYNFAKTFLDNNSIANQISLLTYPLDDFLIKKKRKEEYTYNITTQENIDG